MKRPSKHSWFKFWHKDWLVDPELRVCSPAARGVWIDLICVMANSSEPGVLLVNGKAASPSDIMKLTGISDKRQIVRLVTELEENGVLSRDNRQAIRSRKMCEMYANWKQSVAFGLQGGNPELCDNNTLKEKGVNPPIGITLKTEDRREKIEEERIEDSVLRTAPAAPARAEQVGTGELDLGPSAPPCPPPPPDARTVLFGVSLEAVKRVTGRTDGSCRAWFGKMLKELGDDAAVLNGIVEDMLRQPPLANPTAWVSAAVKAREEPRRSGKPEAFGHIRETPESIFVGRFRAGEIDEDGNELRKPGAPANDVGYVTIEGELA